MPRPLRDQSVASKWSAASKKSTASKKSSAVAPKSLKNLMVVAERTGPETIAGEQESEPEEHEEGEEHEQLVSELKAVKKSINKPRPSGKNTGLGSAAPLAIGTHRSVRQASVIET